jgi:hypothetical protein
MKTNWLPSADESCADANSKSYLKTIVSILSSSRASRLSRAKKNRTAYKLCRIPRTGITGLPNSIRLPATSDNRCYLRLLRNAEESRWKTSAAQVKKATPDAHLPSATGFTAEAWLMRIVGAISLAAIGYAAMDSIRFAESWTSFVGWVRIAVGG